MRLTPPWTEYMTRRELDGMSDRQLHALAEAADCDLRGFAPDQTSLVFFTMIVDRLTERNDMRGGSKCVCVYCLDPFPFDDCFEPLYPSDRSVTP